MREGYPSGMMIVACGENNTSAAISVLGGVVGTPTRNSACIPVKAYDINFGVVGEESAVNLKREAR
jgi:hypothetical protein